MARLESKVAFITRRRASVKMEPGQSLVVSHGWFVQ